MPDIAFKPATALAADLRARKIGAAELLEHYIARMERHNPALNAIIATDLEGARQRARAADEALARGETWGPLHGVPMTLKESYDLPGLPTTWGMPAMRENIASKPALSAQRLADAGAVIFGKTNVPFALGDWQSFNDIYGTTNNPWDKSRSPGGSSGGSAAALAAGLTGLEAGSDIGGSIRNPAHFCGLFGHKPTWGILPPRGHALPGILSRPDLSVIGPLARSAEDLAVAVDVMAGPDELEADGWALRLAAPRHSRLGDFRVAIWADDPQAPVDAAVTDRIAEVARVLAEAGARIADGARPDFEPLQAHRAYLTLLFAVVTSREPKEMFEEAKRKVDGLAAGDFSMHAMTTRARVLHHRDWLAANETRTRLRWAWRRFFDAYDVLLMPVSTTPAFPHDHHPVQTERVLKINGQDRPYLDNLFWAGLATAAYLPATAAPIGRSGGLPVGLQIVGAEGNDRTTIEFARLLSERIGSFEAPPGYA